MRINFSDHRNVIAGVSERADGSMVWGNRVPVDPAARENRNRFFEQQGIDPLRVVSGGLTHGVRVARVGEADAGEYLLNTDAMITNVPNLFLTITVADCVPVFFYDPLTASIGIAHAGWRGIIGGIAGNVAAELRNAFGAEPESCTAAIGPHIRSCHFEVREEVAVQFDPASAERREGKVFVNMEKEVTSQLRERGIRTIISDSPCTYCGADRFYSARRDKKDPLEGMVAYIGMTR